MHFPSEGIQEPLKKCLSPGLGQELYKISLGMIIVPERRKINNTAVSCQKDTGACSTFFKIKCLKTKTQSLAEGTATGLRCNDLGIKQLTFAAD